MMEYEEIDTEDYDGDYQDPETGTKTIIVESGHFIFWPCKCGHVYGRHWGELLSGKIGHCFDCKTCKKFFPAQTLEKWRGKDKLTPTLAAWYASIRNSPESH